MTDDTRAEFERWLTVVRGAGKLDLARAANGPYVWDWVGEEWRTWQAAITAERTRCAAIARKHGAEDAAREMECS